ncbi:uncharacterized protein LOC131529850 isoform X2 [Onychostoma macrolepis]|nr:uncharacterized protein LOC131529850 isoform X2 [Onychostoma macrolepis]
MQGESVTLHTGVETNQQDRIRWYFNDTRIAQITGDLSKICTDVQCNNGTERFRGRLKLDHQTGSLTIMNITTPNSGVYKLLMSNGIIKTFSVSVTAVPDSGLSTAVISSVAVAAVVLLVAAAGVIYCCCRRSTPAGQNGTMTQHSDPDLGGNEQQVQWISNDELTDLRISVLQCGVPRLSLNRQTDKRFQEHGGEPLPLIQDEILQMVVADRTSLDQTFSTMKMGSAGEASTDQNETTLTDAAGGASADQAETLQTGAAEGANVNQAETGCYLQ